MKCPQCLRGTFGRTCSEYPDCTPATRQPPATEWLVVESNDPRGFDGVRIALAAEGFVYVGHEGDDLFRPPKTAHGYNLSRKGYRAVEPAWFFVRNVP